MHRRTPACHLLAFAFALPTQLALAEPSITARIADQPIDLRWHEMQPERYSTELTLPAGRLELGTAGAARSQPLAAYR